MAAQEAYGANGITGGDVKAAFDGKDVYTAGANEVSVKNGAVKVTVDIQMCIRDRNKDAGASIENCNEVSLESANGWKNEKIKTIIINLKGYEGDENQSLNEYSVWDISVDNTQLPPEEAQKRGIAEPLYVKKNPNAENWNAYKTVSYTHLMEPGRVSMLLNTAPTASGSRPVNSPLIIFTT